MTDNALAIIEENNVVTYFKPQGLDPILEKILSEVKGVVLDISTVEGRKQIASLAYKVAKTKTALDEIGKKLTEDTKKQIKAVDAERSRAWDALEALQKEVRAPLTEWEEKEKARVAVHEAALAAIPEHPGYGQHETAEEISRRLAHLENLPPRKWEEFEARATKAIAAEIDRTKNLLAVAQNREAEQAELARLRREKEEREQKERDERLKAEAAEQARLEAEEKARKEAEKVEQARLEAERKAKEAADALAAKVKADQEVAAAREAAIQREKDEADERARKAEEARIAAEVKAKADLKAAEEKAAADARAAAEKAQRDADEAARRERDKIEAEKKAEAEATAQREADKAHRAKINNEILAALLASPVVGLTGVMAKSIIGAIAKGEIPHVKISY